jgi:hypothetical protein
MKRITIVDKVLVLAVIVGIGTMLFGEFTEGFGPGDLWAAFATWLGKTAQEPMTLPAVVQASASIIGFLVIGIQIFFLIRGLQGTTQDRLYAHYMEICKLFLQYPHLRPYFYDKAGNPQSAVPDPKITNKTLVQQIDFMSEAILGLIEHSVVQLPNLPTDSWEGCWHPYAVERVKKSPALQEFYKSNLIWYADQMRTQMDRILEAASADQAPPKANIYKTASSALAIVKEWFVKVRQRRFVSDKAVLSDVSSPQADAQNADPRALKRFNTHGKAGQGTDEACTVRLPAEAQRASGAGWRNTGGSRAADLAAG